jgi:hypothetical protein
VRKLLAWKEPDNGHRLVHLMAIESSLAARPKEFYAWMALGVDPNALTVQGRHALAIAAPEMVPLLVTSGADLYAGTAFGQSVALSCLRLVETLTRGPASQAPVLAVEPQLHKAILRLTALVDAGWLLEKEPDAARFTRTWKTLCRRHRSGSRALSEPSVAQAWEDFDRAFRRERLTKVAAAGHVPGATPAPAPARL